MKILVTILLAVVTLAAWPAHGRTDAWSPPVDGLQARLLFEPGDVHHGIRYVRTLLEIRNVSDVANPLYVFYDPTRSLRPRLVDEKGRAVPSAPAAASVLSPSAHYLAVPWHGTLRFDVTAFGYAVARPDGAVLGLHGGVWTVPTGSRRFLEATFSGVDTDTAAPGRVWKGELHVPATPVACP